MDVKAQDPPQTKPKLPVQTLQFLFTILKNYSVRKKQRKANYFYKVMHEVRQFKIADPSNFNCSTFFFF